MKALIVFESIFGNTQHIAEAIAEGLRGEIEVEVAEVGKARPGIDGADLIVIGGPTHAWGMSRTMTRSFKSESSAAEWLTMRYCTPAREVASMATRIPVTSRYLASDCCPELEAALLSDAGPPEAPRLGST